MEQKKEVGTKDSSLSTLHYTVFLYRLRVVCGFSTLSHFPVPPFFVFGFPFAYFSPFFYRTRYVFHTFILDSSVFSPCVFPLCGET